MEEEKKFHHDSCDVGIFYFATSIATRYVIHLMDDFSANRFHLPYAIFNRRNNIQCDDNGDASSPPESFQREISMPVYLITPGTKHKRLHLNIGAANAGAAISLSQSKWKSTVLQFALG